MGEEKSGGVELKEEERREKRRGRRDKWEKRRDKGGREGSGRLEVRGGKKREKGEDGRRDKRRGGETNGEES